MGRRVGQLAGFLALILALGRLSRLFEGGPGTPPWQLILLASTFLGAVAWWLLSQVTANLSLKLAFFTVGGLLLALRISVPQTLVAGILPSGSTAHTLGSEMDIAWRTIQSGIPPVEPFVGLLAILAVLMWSIGGFYTWGSADGPHAALFVPSLVMYFQFAVFDRRDADPIWMFFAAVALALAVVSMALERHQETGRARDADGRPLRRRSLALATMMASILGIVAIALAGSASDVINEYGNAPWRNGSGLGPGPGSGVSYDGLVELRQRVLDQSEIPVFTARLASDTPEGINPYWRMDTLDAFDGEEWSRSDTSSTRYESGRPVVDVTNLYRGTTTEILQSVRIEALNSIIAPTAGTPVEIQDPADDVDSPRFADEFYAVGGVSIGVAGGLSEADQYQLRTTAIDRSADLGALATDATGELSAIFAAAREAGEFPYEPAAVDPNTAILPDREHYLILPNSTPSGIGQVAREATRGHTTDFEAGWMLQSWFRDEGNFEYSTAVTTGHSSLVLDDWLNEPSSLNYRKGYCEQFAAAMGVLARSIGIPSRVVWGFTPGDVDENGVITVRDTNAHAWVELWIEPYGWFPFDPTPRAEQTGFDSQPPSFTAALDPTDYLEIPEDNPTTVTIDPNAPDNRFLDDAPDPFAEQSGTSTRWWLIGLVALMTLAASIPLFKTIRRRLRLSRIRDGDITAAWDEIVDRLTDLGVDVNDSLTPVELARSTNHALLPLALSYSSTVYGGRSGQATERDLVEVEWWMDRTYEGSRRARASLSLRSVLRHL